MTKTQESTKIREFRRRRSGKKKEQEGSPTLPPTLLSLPNSQDKDTVHRQESAVLWWCWCFFTEVLVNSSSARSSPSLFHAGSKIVVKSRSVKGCKKKCEKRTGDNPNPNPNLSPIFPAATAPFPSRVGLIFALLVLVRPHYIM